MGRDQAIAVCHIASGDLWAGAEVQVYTLLVALNQVPGLSVTALIMNEAKLARMLREAGVSVDVLDESEYGFAEIVRRAKPLLRERDIDILHSHRYKENMLAVRLKKVGIGRCLVQTVHGQPEPFRGFKGLKARLFSVMNAFYTRKYFDRVQVVSDDIAERLAGAVDPAKLVTIHNAVDPSRIVPSRPAEDLRRELGIEKDAFVIGTAGRMVPIKGYDVFLRAARVVLDKKHDIVFLVVGDGPEKKHLEEQAKDLGLQGNVLFPGFRDDIIDVVNCFDAYAISSHHEGVPISLLEAMALGKAIVTTAVGGINEVVEDGLSAVTVPPGDPQALADACMRVVEEPQLRRSLQAAAARRITEEFSIQTTANRVLKLYKELKETA